MFLRLERILFESWWLILIFIFCYMAYEQMRKRVNQEYENLYTQLIVLQRQKEQALAEQKDFQLQVNSQSDVHWIELTLMGGLGLVPEGQIKVYFE